MRLYRVVAYVLNLNGDSNSKQQVIDNIQNNRHPEFIEVEEIQETDCGEWEDDHELNNSGNDKYLKYFPDLDTRVENSEFQKAFQDLRTENLELMDQIETMGIELRSLQKEIEKFKKIKEFLQTIGNIIK